MTNHMIRVDADDFPEPHMEPTMPPQPREIHVGSLKIGRQKGPVRITVLGKTCKQPGSLVEMLRSTDPVEFQAPLPPGLTADELRQTSHFPLDGLGFLLAAVIMFCAALGGLLLHAAARAGWL